MYGMQVDIREQRIRELENEVACLKVRNRHQENLIRRAEAALSLADKFFGPPAVPGVGDWEWGDGTKFDSGKVRGAAKALSKFLRDM